MRRPYVGVYAKVRPVCKLTDGHVGIPLVELVQSVARRRTICWQQDVERVETWLAIFAPFAPFCGLPFVAQACAVLQRPRLWMRLLQLQLADSSVVKYEYYYFVTGDEMRCAVV